MTKQKRKKLLKERHIWWLGNKIHEEDRYTEKDLHPDREGYMPDNK